MAKQKTIKSVVDSPFGRLIGELRLQHGLSMHKLAKKSGISAAYICRLESGERHPSRDLALKLADILLEGSSQIQKDEILVAAGFAPTNYRNFMGRQDVEAIYEAILRENPDDFSTFVQLLYSWIRSGAYEKAHVQIQEGVIRFPHQIQLHVLTAALQLSQGDLEKAIESQQQALSLFHQQGEINSSLRLLDLYLSLGVLYFEQGHRHAARCAQGEKEKQAAFSCLSQAQSAFELALKEDPQDVYVRDELARVYFTWAYLLPDLEAKPLWKKASESFEQAICSPHKADLGAQALLQSTAFLALSYSKWGAFEQAWFTLSVAEACLPHFWLIHYIKACYFGLKLKHGVLGALESSEQLVEACLAALAQSIAIHDGGSQAQTEARYEPDFSRVRELAPEAFTSLIGGNL